MLDERQLTLECTPFAWLSDSEQTTDAFIDERGRRTPFDGRCVYAVIRDAGLANSPEKALSCATTETRKYDVAPLASSEPHHQLLSTRSGDRLGKVG